MTVGAFRGYPSLQELQCSGENLPAGSDLVYMVLFKQATGKILAFINLRKGECSTAEDYVSCDVDSDDTRRSRLRVLLTDVDSSATAFGCNVTVIGPGGMLKTLSWWLAVDPIRECVGTDGVGW